MGLRETLARCFGRRSGSARTIGEEVDRHIREAEKLLPSKGGLIDPNNWSKAILDSYKDALSLGGFTIPEEKVCPLTKQIVLQELNELALQHPHLSIKQIIGLAMANGVKDDYELAERLKALAKEQIAPAEKFAPDTTIDVLYSAQHMAHRVLIKRHDKAMHVLMDDI